MSKFLISLFLLSTAICAQYNTYRIFPSNNIQIEPSIVRGQQNPQTLFASAMTVSGGGVVSEGVYVSTNGGINWSGTDVIPNSGGDAGDPGPIIDKNGTFILTHQRSFPVVGMFCYNSTNMGVNWSSNATVATGDRDKGSPITDDVPSSPNYGRTYLAWTKFLSPFPIVVSYTGNGGANWTSYVQVNNTYNGNVSYGPSLATGNNGEVYVCWASAIPASPSTEDKIGFARSTNGGNNWTVWEAAYDCNGIRTSQLSPWTIRANSFPIIDIDKSGGPRNGWLYIVTAEKNLAPAGTDPDVVMHRSTDGGQTWSPGIRVNQDLLNNGNIQFFPIIRVDENGGLNVIYYDNRNSTDSVDVYLSRSTDGGSSWFDYRVSNHRFKPKPPSGTGQGNMGDNIGITSGSGKLYPIWMGDYSGNMQVWSAIIDYSTIGINKISTDIPKIFTLYQNYPNPFNPSTEIKFDLPASPVGIVKLSVYDITGKELRVLVNQKLSSGSYAVSFDAEGLASGVYMYNITAIGYSQTKAMVVIK